MSKRTRRWISALAVVAVVSIAVVLYLARRLANRIEPYIRDQIVQYLEDKFDADVAIASLSISLPAKSRFKMWWTKGRGSTAEITLTGIQLKRKESVGTPPLLAMKHLSFQVDIGRVIDKKKEVKLVRIDGMEIHIPPKGQRARNSGGEESKAPSDVVLEEIAISNAGLFLHSRDPKKYPLEFQIRTLTMRSNGFDKPTSYKAVLTNPKPPGLIDSKGTFGPWNRYEPGASPLSGDYIFSSADLGVFNAIAGMLNSTGKFSGELQQIYASGEATVPDFRLKMSGNPVPLRTNFEVEVDGTNGNTLLKPVRAVLGRSAFTTSGSVIKHEEDPRRTIELDVKMPAGRLEDFLRLAMKGEPQFMTGTLNLNARVMIPPLTGKVVDKLRLRGTFDIREGQFLKSRIQDKIDALSRRAQGEPKNEGIDEVVSRMAGAFVMENQRIDFSRLAFDVPGAEIKLAGNYDLDAEIMDFRGTMALKARVSQTQTGWKRWALKPVDPFFAKHGAGTFAKIKIEGTRSAPKFGRDR